MFESKSFKRNIDVKLVFHKKPDIVDFIKKNTEVKDMLKYESVYYYQSG